MALGKRLARYSSNPAVLIGLTLLTGGLFKVAAFAREAFIAGRFGLTAITDAYFGLQQFPITLATFMFGAFALAFTPAYADARGRSGSVSWLPGLVLYGSFIGLAFTCGMLACSSFLLQLFTRSASTETWSTLAVLSMCFAPIVWVGIWAGICTARGRNLWAMSMTGLPYLMMTLGLLGLYAAGALNNLGLPISMSLGFGAVGLYSLVRIVRSQRMGSGVRTAIRVWRNLEFRAFLRQLAASSIENTGYAVNQLLMLYFLARAGTGMVSANNCAMRIGMLGYSLLAQPLAQLVQARLCTCDAESRLQLFRRWLVIVAGSVFALALVLYAFRVDVIRLVYMHGKFKTSELGEVTGILPAWIGYFAVMSLNAIVARYLFTGSKGSTYVRRMLWAYAVANLFRFAIAGSVSAAWIIWCSVAAEGCALAVNLRTCLAESNSRLLKPGLTAAEEAC